MFSAESGNGTKEFVFHGYTLKPPDSSGGLFFGAGSYLLDFLEIFFENVSA